MRLKARLEPASLGALREYLINLSQAPTDPETP